MRDLWPCQVWQEGLTSELKHQYSWDVKSCQAGQFRDLSVQSWSLITLMLNYASLTQPLRCYSSEAKPALMLI